MSLLLFLYLLITWKVETAPQHQLNMYNANNYQNGYCLYSELSLHRYNYNDVMTKSMYQIIAYCLRLMEEDNFIAPDSFQNADDPGFNFTELKERNITSDMLLSWSASIDLAEQYEIYLSSDLDTISEKTILFHNCTSLWFGPSCRFTFDFEVDKSFTKIVDAVYISRLEVENDTKVTCYKHIHCETFLLCLDWRNICDRKWDCLDGSDEQDCWELEVNECADNEYQCHNGQCISIEFYHDVLSYPDCLDGTDENREHSTSKDCSIDRDFSCEELMCRAEEGEFACGNGQCTSGIEKCYNGHSNILESDFCSNAIACLMGFYNQIDSDWCSEFCSDADCIRENCPDRFEFCSIPPLLGHIRFLFSNNLKSDEFIQPDYVCYNETLCANVFPVGESIDKLTCLRFTDLELKNTDSYEFAETFFEKVKERFRPCLITTNEIDHCNYSTMYQCENSTKCISKRRLLDGIHDCPFNDDETYNQSCSLSNAQQRFKCLVGEDEKCFSPVIILDGERNCDSGEDESSSLQQLLQKRIIFPLICDGRTDLLPVLINGRNETDETECEQWPCNNTYSRCDNFWLCKNGGDEINCRSSICPALHHECIFPNDKSKVSCLPIVQAGDGVDNCLGGTDERKKYVYFDYPGFRYSFHCWNDTKSINIGEICNGKKNCRFSDDETFCQRFGSLENVCVWSGISRTNVEDFFCNVTKGSYRKFHYFKLRNVPIYPRQLMNDNAPMWPPISMNPGQIDGDGIIYIESYDLWQCNQGIPIRIRMETNRSELFCLCSPSYYGDKCQYQSQRVSLTVQIRVSSDWRSIFIFLITLIDNERNIESHDYIEYLPIRDCAGKFNIYLLYSTRPKNTSKNYSVQIDAFVQLTLEYRASWIFPLQFPFLPVHRLPVLLTVPLSDMEPIHQCWPPCIHGQCFHYVNNPNSTFCRCHPEWSGSQCNVKYACDCAAGSICISDSICLCPAHRFGPRCYLFQTSCHPESCLNGGRCLSGDARVKLGNRITSTCICPEGYLGDRCQNQHGQTRIDITFHSKLDIPPLLVIHLIALLPQSTHNRTSILKKIGFSQYSSTFLTSLWFNIAIVQIFTDYYLIVLQEKAVTLADVSTEIIPSRRCQSISELFNDTFVKEHLLKRIKYYNFPCSQQPELVCFYDEVHFCLCNLDRTANCFEFDHNMTHDCQGLNFCKNEGYCFQDNPKCPTPPICACRQCYFGSKCQFSTEGSTLSLDTILGHHIHIGSGIRQQADIVKVAIALTMLTLVFGSINIVLCLITFQGKETRNVGCGFYLFASSVISLNIVIVLTSKLWLLLTSQTGSISNRSILKIQCISIDFVLRCLLSINDWLSACVATERAVNVSKGVNFNKEKSKQIAKWITSIVILCTGCTYLYDPLHRRLIDDEEEQRAWCVTQYSSTVQIFDWILNIIHFSLPFSINCISAVVVIIVAARSRSNSQKKKLFREHLREQLQHHKHLLISPLMLVILALPRLIISFFSGCMKSARNSWFYLIGYFISFIPSMMTFIVFVLPSEMYKKEFRKSMKQICRR